LAAGVLGKKTAKKITIADFTPGLVFFFAVIFIKAGSQRLSAVL